MNDQTTTDPVRARRRRIAKFTQLANRVGYLLWGVAIATFVIGFVGSFSDTISTIVIATLLAGSVLLAPAIILGYAIKAAEREDREHGV
ncbi:MAG: hypothetical protein HY826_13865 [Actinobacteria bacterium]|nr:hypothetical protein [Actinomycetota bacterium]